MHLGRRAAAEFVGTFWLVLCGCGAAVLAARYDGIGGGIVGVSLAFGLALLTAAYSLGPISGCHLNPAVTVGIWAAGRFPVRDIAPYVAAQVGGATVATVTLLLIASGSPDYNLSQMGLAENGYGLASPGHYSLAACFVTEAVLTCGFLVVILGATDRRALAGYGPLAIGLALTVIHLISIPVTNTSVNPARSTGPALLVGRAALDQLWLFWVAPILGAIVGALVYRMLFAEEAAKFAVPELSEDP
ncbi:MAG TPA: aquaporin Z [Allosphingosinicella sp.]|jgi:aquaporin Z|nr:aquaporin Z [Allosphingosinicella sp.]